MPPWPMKLVYKRSLCLKFLRASYLLGPEVAKLSFKEFTFCLKRFIKSLRICSRIEGDWSSWDGIRAPMSSSKFLLAGM